MGTRGEDETNFHSRSGERALANSQQLSPPLLPSNGTAFAFGGSDSESSRSFKDDDDWGNFESPESAGKEVAAKARQQQLRLLVLLLLIIVLLLHQILLQQLLRK